MGLPSIFTFIPTHLLSGTDKICKLIESLTVLRPLFIQNRMMITVVGTMSLSLAIFFYRFQKCFVGEARVDG